MDGKPYNIVKVWKDIKYWIEWNKAVDGLRTKKKTKNVSLGMNNIMGMHRIVRNNIKTWYSELMQEQMDETMSFYKVKIYFFLFKGDKRRRDRSNFLSIHEKFFMDAFVKYGCIEDDNDDFVESTHYYDGGFDKGNSRVEIFIEEIS